MKNTSQTNTRPQNTVRSIGVESIEFDGYEDVYNMEVADNHNYAVNGGAVLHNCDATRYFVKTLKLALPKEEYKGVYNS